METMPKPAMFCLIHLPVFTLNSSDLLWKPAHWDWVWGSTMKWVRPWKDQPLKERQTDKQPLMRDAHHEELTLFEGGKGGFS